MEWNSGVVEELLLTFKVQIFVSILRRLFSLFLVPLSLKNQVLTSTTADISYYSALTSDLRRSKGGDKKPPPQIMLVSLELATSWQRCCWTLSFETVNFNFNFLEGTFSPPPPSSTPQPVPGFGGCAEGRTYLQGRKVSSRAGCWRTFEMRVPGNRPGR